VLVTIAFGVANVILLEAALSFLGFGVSPPNHSWGEILRTWMHRRDAWWLVVFPGAAIALTVFTYNTLADVYEEAANPRYRVARRISLPSTPLPPEASASRGPGPALPPGPVIPT
jgi:peptide/nickel transport system permease protein